MPPPYGAGGVRRAAGRPVPTVLGRRRVRDAGRGDVFAEGRARLGHQAALAVPVDQPGHPLLGLQRAQRHRGDRAHRAAHAAPGRVQHQRDGGDGPAGAGAAGGLEEGLRGVQQRDADEAEEFAGAQRVQAGQQMADRHLARPPSGPARITVASSAASTGRVSPVGAAVTMLPPRVPALRICGGPAARAAAARRGSARRSRGGPCGRGSGRRRAAHGRPGTASRGSR